jgi:hypothetical protein
MSVLFLKLFYLVLLGVPAGAKRFASTNQTLQPEDAVAAVKKLPCARDDDTQKVFADYTIVRKIWRFCCRCLYIRTTSGLYLQSGPDCRDCKKYWLSHVEHLTREEQSYWHAEPLTREEQSVWDEYQSKVFQKCPQEKALAQEEWCLDSERDRFYDAVDKIFAQQLGPDEWTTCALDMGRLLPEYGLSWACRHLTYEKIEEWKFQAAESQLEIMSKKALSYKAAMEAAAEVGSPIASYMKEEDEEYSGEGQVSAARKFLDGARRFVESLKEAPPVRIQKAYLNRIDSALQNAESQNVAEARQIVEWWKEMAPPTNQAALLTGIDKALQNADPRFSFDRPSDAKIANAVAEARPIVKSLKEMARWAH